MPVTAPTSSAMVTTRIARLMLTFQLVKMLGTIAGSISLMKNCGVVGRNERIMLRNSRGTPRIASSVSIRNTGPQTTTSTKPMRNSTPGNHSTANRIHDTTGTAIRSRIMGCRYFSSDVERYIATASARPSTKDTKSAPITRASVTRMSAAVMVARLWAILTKLGIANGGIPSAGARCDRSSQHTAKTSSDTSVWRGKVRSRTKSRCSWWAAESRSIDDLLVRHLLIQALRHGPRHHVGGRLAGRRLPGRLNDHLQPLARNRRRENAGRQLQGLVGDLVGRLGFGLEHFRDVLQRSDQHPGRVRRALDGLGAHCGNKLPAVDAGHLAPALGAVEDHPPVRVLLQDDAGERLDHQRSVDPAGLELGARHREVGVDGDDVLAEIDAFRVQDHAHDLELRAAHVDGELLALEVGERLDRRILGEDHEVAQREARGEDAKRHALLIELLQDGRPADQHLGLAGREGRIERRDRRIGPGLEFEAVLQVEAARLHHVPDQRIEHRQGQARSLDLRLVLRLRGREAGRRESKRHRERCNTASIVPKHDLVLPSPLRPSVMIFVSSPPLFWRNRTAYVRWRNDRSSS